MKSKQRKINDANFLIEACNLISQMKIAEQNQDVQGDPYEYMLGYMQFAGRGGQFRTPWQEEFAGVVAQVESLRGRMGEAERQVEGLFESLLAQSFGDW